MYRSLARREVSIDRRCLMSVCGLFGCTYCVSQKYLFLVISPHKEYTSKICGSVGPKLFRKREGGVYVRRKIVMKTWLLLAFEPTTARFRTTFPPTRPRRHSVIVTAYFLKPVHYQSGSGKKSTVIVGYFTLYTKPIKNDLKRNYGRILISAFMLLIFLLFLNDTSNINFGYYFSPHM